MRTHKALLPTELFSQLPPTFSFPRQDLMHPRLTSQSLCAKNDLEPLTLQSPPLKPWNNRHVALHLVNVVLEIKPGALRVLGRQATNSAMT